MIKNTIADIIAYYSKMSMTEVLPSNVADFYPVTLLRNENPSWISSYFSNGYGLDQLREGLLLKESYTTIHHLLGIVKLPRKNNSQKIVRCKFQMILIRYGKRLKLAAKIRQTKCFLMTSRK